MGLGKGRRGTPSCLNAKQSETSVYAEGPPHTTLSEVTNTPSVSTVLTRQHDNPLP